MYPGFSTLLALGWLYLLKISPRLLLAFRVKNSSLEVVLAASLLAAPHHPHTHALCSTPAGPPSWNTGVVGMKIGGVREIQIPGELAYGSSREICGTTNSPLKFVVMAIEDTKLNELNNELDNIYAELMSKYYDSSSVQVSE